MAFPEFRETLFIDSDDDENTVFYVGWREIASVNHDEHGWAGMGAVEDALVAFAKAANYDVQHGNPKEYK